MADTRYGIRQHCANFLSLPIEDRFEAAKASMLCLGVFQWSDRELEKWCRQSTHDAHEATRVARMEKRASARGKTGGGQQSGPDTPQDGR